MTPPADPDPPAQLSAVIPPGAVAIAAAPVALVPALIAYDRTKERLTQDEIEGV
jgi:hypothetical protein